MNAAELIQVLGELRSPCIHTCAREDESHYRFALRGKTQNWQVLLQFSNSFPYRLPKAKLENEDWIGKIPHVNQSGTICFEESDSLWVDYTAPSEVVDHFLDELVKLLDRYSLAIYKDELLDEFEGYFLAPELDNSVNSFYHAGDVVEEPKLRLKKKNNTREQHSVRPVLLEPVNSAIPENFSNANSNGDLSLTKIIHIPLENAVLPPENAAGLTSRYIYGLKAELSPSNRKKLDKQLRKGYRDHFSTFILLSMPRSIGERTQLLLQFTADEILPHPLKAVSEKWRINVFRLNQLNASYLLERGGAEYSQQDKHIAIIGCGSVGSEVAYMLAKAGVGKLTLIDKDHLSPDNIYRHRLGGRSINFKASDKGKVDSYTKTSSLKLSIEQDLPYTNVISIPKNFCQQHLSEISDVDLVIVAVGSPTESFMLNRLLKAGGVKKAVFSWNEAAGVGGHAISLDYDHSCFECLHSNDDGITAKTELTLVEPGQAITKNLTGCAGVFTPFSYLDSSRTAEIATQLAIKSLLKDEHSIALSWKGENSSNLNITERFDSIPLKEELPLTRSAHCGVCNG